MFNVLALFGDGIISAKISCRLGCVALPDVTFVYSCVLHCARVGMCVFVVRCATRVLRRIAHTTTIIYTLPKIVVGCRLASNFVF